MYIVCIYEKLDRYRVILGREKENQLEVIELQTWVPRLADHC